MLVVKETTRTAEAGTGELVGDLLGLEVGLDDGPRVGITVVGDKDTGAFVGFCVGL